MSCHPPDGHDGVACKQAYDLLFDYLEGNLSGGTVEAVRAHFEACPPCLEFLESYKRTPGLCRKALEQQVPAEVKSQLKAFLRKSRGQP